MIEPIKWYVEGVISEVIAGIDDFNAKSDLKADYPKEIRITGNGIDVVVPIGGAFSTPKETVQGFKEGTHHAVTINQAHERYRKIMFGIRASLPDAREDDIRAIEWAIETALENPKVQDAMRYYQNRDIIASVAEGVDICV